MEKLAQGFIKALERAGSEKDAIIQRQICEVASLRAQLEAKRQSPVTMSDNEASGEHVADDQDDHHGDETQYPDSDATSGVEVDAVPGDECEYGSFRESRITHVTLATIALCAT